MQLLLIQEIEFTFAKNVNIRSLQKPQTSSGQTIHKSVEWQDGNLKCIAIYQRNLSGFTITLIIMFVEVSTFIRFCQLNSYATKQSV